ncbi:MAG: hypothetical protein ABI581_04430 [Sediminibacterium sp.]
MILNIPKSLAFFTFLMAVLYPPLVFYGFMSDTLRVGLFALLLISLFSWQILRSYQPKRVVTIVYCWVIFFIYTVASMYVNWNGAFKSTMGYSMILVFAICIFSIMRSERGSEFSEALLKYYVKFFYMVSVCAIINFLVNIFLPVINFLTPFLADNPYHYEISPFGLSVSKPILGINFVRSFFYFIEPVYLALFYLFNVFVIGPSLPKRSKFVLLNIIGGVVTFSYLFFIGYIIMKALKMRTFYKVLTVSIIVLFYLAFQNSILPGLLESSSADNRFSRLETALEFIKNIGAQKILFGIGIEYDYISDFGINAGILSTVIENGLFGLVFLLTIMLLFAQKNTFIILIIFLGLLTVEPFKLPLFWLTVVLAGEINRRQKANNVEQEILTT